MKFTGKRTALLVILTISCVLTIVGRLKFDYAMNAIMETQVKKHMALENGTIAYHKWVKPPITVLFNIYVFDVVNAKAVVQRQAVPIVMEKGPYVYRLYLEKTDINFHDNGTVTYRQPETYVYADDLSVGPETDTFTSLNNLFYIVATIMKDQPALVQTAVSDLFEAMGEKAFITMSVHDIWWGFDDIVLKKLEDMMQSLHINKTIPYKFGFNMDKNNTDSGTFNVYSGRDGNFDNFEMIDRWNGIRKLSIWNSDYANRIAGTDSSGMPPFLQKNKNLSYFDSHLGRTLNLIYQKPTKVGGVDAYRYIVPFSDFASAKTNPINAGFCTPDVNYCLPSGALNFSTTAQGLPLVLSLPHFVGGDEYYQQQVQGMKPSPEKHQPFFEYQTVAGVNLHSARRYQIVMHITPMKHFPAFRNLPEAFLPIIWIDGVGHIDDASLNLFKTDIQDTLDMMVYVKGVLVGIVCLLAILFICLVLYWSRKDAKNGRADPISQIDGDDEQLLSPGLDPINTVYDDYPHSPTSWT